MKERKPHLETRLSHVGERSQPAASLLMPDVSKTRRTREEIYGIPWDDLACSSSQDRPRTVIFCWIIGGSFARISWSIALRLHLCEASAIRQD